MRARAATLMALAAVIVLAGCGGGGNISASAYRQAGNAACRRERAETLALVRAAPHHHLTASQVITRLGKVDADFLATMRHLNPPTNLYGEQDKLVTDLIAIQPGWWSYPKGHSSRAMQAAPVQRVIADEHRLGFSVCVELDHERTPPIDA